MIFFDLLLPLWSIGLISQFLDHFTDGRTPWTSDQQGLYLNTGQHKHRIKEYTYQTSMLFVRFEPTIPAFERAKTVHALDRPATVTGLYINIVPLITIAKNIFVCKNIFRFCLIEYQIKRYVSEPTNILKHAKILSLLL
jgi:hypothetical protein